MSRILKTLGLSSASGIGSASGAGEKSQYDEDISTIDKSYKLQQTQQLIPLLSTSKSKSSSTSSLFSSSLSTSQSLTKQKNKTLENVTIYVKNKEKDNIDNKINNELELSLLDVDVDNHINAGIENKTIVEKTSDIFECNVDETINDIDHKKYIDDIIKIHDDHAMNSSVIINAEKLFKDDIDEVENDSSNIVYYSQYFSLDVKEIKHNIKMSDMIKDIIIILLLHLFLGVHNAIFNVITIDGILSCLIFYLSYIGVDDGNNFLLRNRLSTIDRYIYYILLFTGYYLYNYVSWFRYSNITLYLASIMICPSMMGQIYNIYTYKRIRQIMYDGYNNLIQKIVCKQMSKILNMVIENILKLDIRVKYEELIPFYDNFSLVIINKFIITFILACIFNHIDKGNVKYLTMIYKNLYMKDPKCNISDDKEYITKIIVEKKWKKLFTDVYTMNRLLRMIFNDNTQSTLLSEQVTSIIKRLIFRFNKVMFCWTIMSVSNLTVGVMSFFLFMFESDRPMRYMINTLFFTAVSFFTVEKLIILIVCELCYPIVDSKLLSDIYNDTYNSLKKGVTNLINHTRLESVLLTIILTYFSFHNYVKYTTLILCFLNVSVMIRFIFVTFMSLIKNRIMMLTSMSTTASITMHKKLNTIIGNANNDNSIINNDKTYSMIDRNKKDNDLINTNHELKKEKDILILLKNEIKRIARENILFKLLNPFAIIDEVSILRLLVLLFSLLFFGFSSMFHYVHMLFLPIVLQNIIDLIL
jgi:hypothetical protein